MYNILVKYGQTMAFVLGILILLGFLLSVFSGLEQYSTLPDEDKATTGIFNFGLSSAVGLVILAAVAILSFGLFQTVTNLGSSLKALIGVGVLVAIFFIAYASGTVESSGPVFEAAQKQGVTEGSSKFITGGITTALILGAGAFLSFIVFEVINFFK